MVLLTCILIDIAIPGDSNVNTKETENSANTKRLYIFRTCIVQHMCEKTNKCASCWSSHMYRYKDLGIEVSRVWKVGTKIVSCNWSVRNN